MSPFVCIGVGVGFFRTAACRPRALAVRRIDIHFDFVLNVLKLRSLF